jgi:hypothetical protein
MSSASLGTVKQSDETQKVLLLLVGQYMTYILVLQCL